jgi:hypothetical protein
MLRKFYLGFGVCCCLGLGIMFAMKVTVPHLGIFDGSGRGGRSGRSGGGYYYSSWGSGK